MGWKRIPQIANLETAIRLYYERVELSSKDIESIFGCSITTVTKLKCLAHEQMDKDDVPNWNARNVNTEAAFKAWGLDIGTLERNLLKLRKLKLTAKENQP